jgi:hypothetical protein
VNLKLQTVTKYANGKAPLVGIPIEGAGCVVVMRKHLQAALSIDPTRIIYNFDTHTLTLRAPGREWKLNDLLGQEKISRQEIQAQHFAWAQGRRSGARTRQATASLGKAGVYARKLGEAIIKLAKQRNKISLRRPLHPLLPSPYGSHGDYGRDQAAAWAAAKPMRKALAKLAGHKLLHGEPKTWADFYRAVERVTGRPVSDQQKFARVHSCKRYRHGLSNYPDREDYLKALPRYLVMTEKPWDQRIWDPYKKEEYGEQLNSFEQHAQARREYVALLREQQALDSQIAAHMAEIKSIMEAA